VVRICNTHGVHEEFVENVGIKYLVEDTDWQKTLIGKIKSRWMECIKTDIKEVGCEGVAWKNAFEDSAQVRVLLNMVTNV
jgi:hypothetical protein